MKMGIRTKGGKETEKKDKGKIKGKFNRLKKINANRAKKS
jgi:hypothetical protein